MKYVLLLVHITFFTLAMWIYHQHQVLAVKTALPQATELIAPLQENNLDCSVPQIDAPSDIRKWVESHPTCSRAPLLKALNVKNLDKFIPEASAQNLSLTNFDFYLDNQTISVLAVQDFAFEQIWYFIFRGYGDTATPSSHKIGYIGYVEFQFQRQFPNVQLIRGENTNWLTIKTEVGHGSGFLLCNENWVALAENTVKPILSYPMYGYEEWSDSVKNRTIKSTPVSYETINGNPTIKVIFSAHYQIDANFFINKRQIVVFACDKATGEFKLDEAQSDLTKDEYTKVYELIQLDDESYLKYNFAELNKFVSQPEARKNERLQNFLKELPTSLQARTLLAQLK